MARLNERNDWFDLWFEDKQAMMGTMMRNMAADLAAGYNYFGASIAKQRGEIERYKALSNPPDDGKLGTFRNRLRAVVGTQKKG